METTHREIKAAVERIFADFNTHDGATFAASFAEDAHFRGVVGATAEGPREIAQLHDRGFKTVLRDSVLNLVDAPVQRITDDVASVSATWTISRAGDPDGTPPSRRGVMLVVLRERAGAWRPVVMQLTDLTHVDPALSVRFTA